MNQIQCRSSVEIRDDALVALHSGVEKLLKSNHEGQVLFVGRVRDDLISFKQEVEAAMQSDCVMVQSVPDYAVLQYKLSKLLNTRG